MLISSCISSHIPLLLDGSPEDLESILASANEAGLASLPVDDLPDVVDVSGLAVEVL